jgi:hypothetical protein
VEIVLIEYCPYVAIKAKYLFTGVTDDELAVLLLMAFALSNKRPSQVLSRQFCGRFFPLQKKVPHLETVL